MPVRAGGPYPELDDIDEWWTGALVAREGHNRDPGTPRLGGVEPVGNGHRLG